MMDWYSHRTAITFKVCAATPIARHKSTPAVYTGSCAARPLRLTDFLARAVWQLTELPKDYPRGFTFPPGVTPNTAGYYDRGWCFCESSVSNMIKDYDRVLDLGLFVDDGKMDEIDDVVE
eukprot:3807615-Prymnesium_polylepis.1